MCGINGIVSKKKDNEFVIEKMNNKIIHRGPDEDGLYHELNDFNTVCMGMRRLSIIDLSTGTQPIYSDDKKIIIVFNGEIYNYKDLKQDLLSIGVKFNTNSDTEVILKLYEIEGVTSFSKLDGMFAFSIYDKRINKVIIARDFFGEKPLYYCSNNQEFIWASELKSIITVIDKKPPISNQALNLYFQLTYIPAPFTIYENIFKLEANNYLTLDIETFAITISEIVHDFEKHDINNKKNAIKKVHDLVSESVISRTISDVPIGTFLSGGVDSSIISWCLANNSDKKIDTFSVGFNNKLFDETDKAQVVAKLLNSNHHQFILSEKDLSDKISEILLNFDEPFADSSALPTYLVSQNTKNFVKVALTGDGGDEVFGGYNKYYMGMLNEKYTSFVPEAVHKKFTNLSNNYLNTAEDSRGIKFKLKRLVKAISYKDDFYYNIISLGFQKDELETLIKTEYSYTNALDFYKNKIKGHKTLTDFRKIDKIISLEGDMLVKVDRTSMLSSLECRAPFLNKYIWNYTNQLPENFLINNWDKKHILKEAFKNYFPENFFNKSKMGFGVPVGNWLRGDLRKELESFINREFLIQQNIFQVDEITNIVYNHLNEKVDNTFRIWTFYCFQKWYLNTYLK